MAEKPIQTRERLPPVWLFLMLGAMLAATLPAASCSHVVAPVASPRLPASVAPDVFDGSLAVDLRNGFEGPEMVPFRSDGIHRVRIDLKEWTQRVIGEVGADLHARGVPPWGSSGGRVLWVRVSGVELPSEPGGEAVISARLTTADEVDVFAGEGRGQPGLRAALSDLRRRIVMSPSLQRFLRGD